MRQPLACSSRVGLQSLCKTAGIRLEDPRIALTMKKVRELEGEQGADAHLSEEQFAELLRPNLRMMCALPYPSSRDVQGP